MASEVSEANRHSASTPTEHVRRLLDERGIEWWSSDDPCCEDVITHWRVGPFQWTAIEGEKDLWLNAGIAGHEPLTPEQAIAATVGRPKVKKVRGMTYDEHGGEVYYLACSGCGEWIDGDLDCITEFDGPNYCPNCGGEFDGPLLCKRCGGLADLEYGDMCVECYGEEAE